MTTLVNTTAASISMRTAISFEKPDDSGRRAIKSRGRLYNFHPGVLTEVDDKDFEWLKENRPLMARSLDLDDIITGRQAKKLADRDKKELERQEGTDKKRVRDAAKEK